MQYGPYTYNSHGQVITSELRDAATSSASTKVIQTQNAYNTTTSDGIQEGAYLIQTKDADGLTTDYTYNYKSVLPDEPLLRCEYW